MEEAGFTEGDLRRSVAIEGFDYFPMALACRMGKLGICKWLHDNGAAEDITRVSKHGISPMFIACIRCHLSVCMWLFEVGAAADITKANDYGETPMYISSWKGHLSVCKWLYEVGAAADIGRMIAAIAARNALVCRGLRRFGVGARRGDAQPRCPE